MKKEKQCPICERGKLMPVKNITSKIEDHIFVEKGERCTSCGEEFIGEKEGQKMITTARKHRMWG